MSSVSLKVKASTDCKLLFLRKSRLLWLLEKHKGPKLNPEAILHKMQKITLERSTKDKNKVKGKRSAGTSFMNPFMLKEVNFIFTCVLTLLNPCSQLNLYSM